MKPNPPASLPSYIKKYLQYRLDPSLHKYREQLEQYEEYLGNALPYEFSMMLSKPLAMVVITYIVGRIFTAVLSGLVPPTTSLASKHGQMGLGFCTT